MKSRIFAIVSLAVSSFVISACNVEIHDVPAGYVAMVLTPTGWDNKIVESGQIDLQQKDAAGRYAVMVIMESTTTTVKEQFLGAGQDPKRKEDGTDHRILTKDGNPLAVDFYVRCMLPDDAEQRKSIFAQITPGDWNPPRPREKFITIEMVYDHFASMDVRGGARRIFARYGSYQDVLNNMEKINVELESMVAETFKRNGVPLKLQNAQISNVKPDEKVYAAQSELSSAQAKVQAINQIGAALRQNPEYALFKKWESLEKIAETGSAKGVNTIIITDGNTKTDVVVPIR